MHFEHIRIFHTPKQMKKQPQNLARYLYLDNFKQKVSQRADKDPRDP
jgi:hypothetical protein